MLSAMLRLGVGDVQDTAYAGGTESGVLCGRWAGARIVAGVLTGGHTRDRLHRAGATHLLGSIAELPHVLAEEGDVSQAAPSSSPSSAPIIPPPAGEQVLPGRRAAGSLRRGRYRWWDAPHGDHQDGWRG